ncbi:MAG: hypothetical protein HDQ87_09920 [Clostridia bacterium]|nr:hypothetical protein [Clostridia bacterium]
MIETFNKLYVQPITSTNWEGLAVRKANVFPSWFAQLCKDMQDAREDADYEFTIAWTYETASECLRLADEFVSQVLAEIESRLRKLETHSSAG